MPTSTCSTASGSSSTRCCAGSCATFRRCASCSSTSRRARRRISCATRRRPSPPRSRRSTCVVAQRALRGRIAAAFYCLPILKRESHRQALVEAATSGNPRFFLGTDSAPHARHTKEAACCGAGCYSAPMALALYAEVFDDANALPKLSDFASDFGADFYGLPRNGETVTLVREATARSSRVSVRRRHARAVRAGETFAWRVA